MRELRFRVWGLYEDGYTYIDEENQAEAESFWDKSCIAVLDEKHIVDCWTDEDGEGEGCEYCDIKEVEAIEQYTGLKDKNSKEIYEGDIVKIVEAKRFNNNMKLVNCRRKIIGNYVVLFDELNGEYVFCESNDIDSAGIAGFPYWAEYCVIGNIHENQELLERKDAKN